MKKHFNLDRESYVSVTEEFLSLENWPLSDRFLIARKKLSVQGRSKSKFNQPRDSTRDSPAVSFISVGFQVRDWNLCFQA